MPLPLLSFTDFQQQVLTWFDQHGRKNLPWQQDRTPYRVWISEIMLQQTQVNTVIPYFIRFMQHFPTLEALAKAAEDEVLHLWTGLGYYSRARHLHRSAQHILREWQGKFPDTLVDLQTLPGIGRSTAGAILAFAFQRQATILDGNVKRVLTRVAGITEWTGEKKTLQQLWQLAEELTPASRTDDYAQAMMDIGATVCIRGKPHCGHCPLRTICIAHTLGIEKTLPQPKPKKTIPIKQSTFLILQYAEQVLLEKRPPVGIWGSLWSLPELSQFATQPEIERFCQQRFQLVVRNLTFGQLFRHTFSHFHLDILPVFVNLTGKTSKIMDSEQQIWYKLRQPQTVGLPAPVKKLLEMI